MDETRILPPQVRGRVTGVLDFFVDEIKLFRNIFLLTNNFDLVLQVQWWGEVLPVFIRPKEVQVPGRRNTNFHLLKTYYHSTKYEIKTTLDLFKSYLKNSEVLELSVLEAFQNYVIGSAFLKDLIKLLSSNNELIKIPIFDYLGEEIGEVTIHVNFLQKVEENKKNLFVNTPPLKTAGEQSDKVGYNIQNKIKSDFFTLAEKTIFYDGHSKKKFEVEESVESKSPSNWLEFRENDKIRNPKLSISVSENNNNLCYKKKNNLINKSCMSVYGSEELACHCLPDVKALSDPSKVLYFGISSKESKNKAVSGHSNHKITNKFNSNSIKCKSKFVVQDGISSKKAIVKEPGNSKSKTKNPAVGNKEKQFEYKILSTSKKLKPEAQTSYESEDFRKIPSKDSPNAKVLNYLLGSNMSKKEEEAALNDFRKMSPSHNLVDSINQLCLASDFDSPKSVMRCNDSSPAHVKQTHLEFDFNNPIERSYYERFFLKTGDFEIAEYLNKPSKGFLSDKFDKSSESEISNIKFIRKFPTGEAEVKETKEKELSNNETRIGCARCKYYKKLDELDTIIESLKNFEQKMLFQEHDLPSSIKISSDISKK